VSGPAASCCALIPVKAQGQGKTRLAPALGPDERAALVGAMLDRVIGAATQASHLARVHVVSPSSSSWVLPEAVHLLDDPGGGLNAALTAGLAWIAAGTCDRVVVIAADLPQVSPADIDLLAAVPEGTVGIAPDRHEVGTNALSLPLPEAAGFVFHFGQDSFAAHVKEAERLGLNAQTILTAGLEKDIDVPGDLADADQVFSTVR